ncbi:MAG: hypothetical protein E7Z67_04820 [Thermoplasmata archaeon]|nr:hypothetical protein [Thermoplasmata archaeon]
MNTKSKKTQGFLAVCAVMMLAAVVLSPALVYSDDAYMEGGTARISLQPGQTWEWTPEFPDGLDPTLTVSNGESFGTSAGWATISGKTLSITVPEDADSSNSQTVILRAETTQPTQVADYTINVEVVTIDFGYGTGGIEGKVTEIGMLVGQSYTLTPTSLGPGTTYEMISGVLPAGIQFNSSNGEISGIPTDAATPSIVTIRATCEAYTPTQIVTTEITIGAYDAIDGESYTVYAIAGETNISIPGFNIPEDVVVETFTNTINGEETLAMDGLTVSGTDGAISGTPTTAGSYTFNQDITATALTGGSNTHRSITVDVDEKITLSGASTFETKVHSGENYEFTATGDPSLELTVAADGIASPESYFSINDAGNTLNIAAGPGTYYVTIKATVDHPSSYDQYGESVSSAMPEDNCAELMVTITIGTNLEYDGPTEFYTNASGSAYDEVDFLEFITGTDSVTTETSDSKYSIGPGGFRLVDSTTPGDYTVTVTIIDDEFDTNRIEVTMNVHVVPDLTFENDPSAGFIVGASA